MTMPLRRRPPPRVTVQLISRISPELKERVSRLALKRGVFEARVIEDAMKFYLDAQKS